MPPEWQHAFVGAEVFAEDFYRVDGDDLTRRALWLWTDEIYVKAYLTRNNKHRKLLPTQARGLSSVVEGKLSRANTRPFRAPIPLPGPGDPPLTREQFKLCLARSDAYVSTMMYYTIAEFQSAPGKSVVEELNALHETKCKEEFFANHPELEQTLYNEGPDFWMPILWECQYMLARRWIKAVYNIREMLWMQPGMLMKGREKPRLPAGYNEDSETDDSDYLSGDDDGEVDDEPPPPSPAVPSSGASTSASAPSGGNYTEALRKMQLQVKQTEKDGEEKDDDDEPETELDDALLTTDRKRRKDEEKEALEKAAPTGKANLFAKASKAHEDATLATAPPAPPGASSSSKEKAAGGERKRRH